MGKLPNSKTSVLFLYLNDEMIISMDATEAQIKKALVAFAVEKTLLPLGEPVYQKVAKTLKDDYACFIPDCYDHPEYLKRILAAEPYKK